MEEKTFLPKIKLGPPNTKGSQEIRNFPSPLLQDKKKLAPIKEIFEGGVGAEYISWKIRTQIQTTRKLLG